MKKTQRSYNSTLSPGKGFKKPTLAEAKPRKPMRKRSKTNPGWIDIAYEILEERGPHCEVCGAFIADPGPINFSHLLPRSTYPDYKRDKRNIRVKDQRCHDLWHKHGPKHLQWSTSWMKVCTLYFELYREAHGIK